MVKPLKINTLMKKELIFGAIVILIVLAGGIRVLTKSSLLPKSSLLNTNQQTSDSSLPTTSTNSDTGTSNQLANTTDPGMSLTVIQPSTNQTVTTNSVVVSGKSAPNADISVNEKDIKADAQGNFSTSVSLDEGENVITVVAVNEFGKTAERDINVTYQTQ